MAFYTQFTLKCKGQVAKSITSHFVLWALACNTDKQCLISWKGWRWVRASDTFVKYGTYRQVTSMAKNVALWNSFCWNIGYAKISPLYIFRPLKKRTIHMKEALDHNENIYIFFYYYLIRPIPTFEKKSMSTHSNFHTFFIQLVGPLWSLSCCIPLGVTTHRFSCSLPK